ncbi:hypothetical protein [Saccharothrix sp. ALI-22-I]|uniref:hypothetical protein n=1 Tax=Saccharothrix sp. ALI-22-I TaxID=1933778 RepID=UPI00097C0BB3|nr:hypothetical protein [Saccharothrix sp. ALI-22-I]
MSYCATTTLQTRPVRHPDQLATPRREPLDTPGSSPLQSPTRTAQPHEEVRPNDHHWHDQPIPPSACTTTADLAIDWPPVIDWPTAEPELRADHTDTGFAGYFAKPAVVKPAFAESTVVKSAVLEPLVPEPAVAESAVLVTVVEQTAVLEAVEETAVLETLVEQTVVLEAVVEDATPGEYTTDWEYTLGEYTPGDLARWYDEAAARLDAEIGTNFASRPW